MLAHQLDDSALQQQSSWYGFMQTTRVQKSGRLGDKTPTMPIDFYPWNFHLVQSLGAERRAL